MVCPAGRVNTNDQPLIAAPLLVIVIFAVYPVFHGGSCTNRTLQPPGLPWLDDAGLDDAGREDDAGCEDAGREDDAGCELAGVPFSPRNTIAIMAWPASGRLCPTPWT